MTNRYAIDETAIGGWATYNGAGAATQIMVTSGDGIKADAGVGSAVMVMTTSGAGTKADSSAGQATMVMASSGNGTKADSGAGQAVMAMLAAATAAAVELAHGAAVMEMVGYAGIPAPGHIDPHAGAAHPSTVLHVDRDQSAVTVAPDGAEMIVGQDQATVRVEKDRTEA